MRTKFTIIGLILFLFMGMVQATNYYVNPETGVDETSTHGTSPDMPWKTFEFALSNTSAGENVINLSAGSYSISYTCYLQLGTDIVGAGIDQTIITFSGTEKVFGMWSDTDETGNHVLSDFTIDCQDANIQGFVIGSRSGVTIERVRVKNSSSAAIFAFAQKPEGEPVFYLRNIIVRNCEFTNCGGPQSSYIGGVVEIGNVDGMLFYDNHIENTINISYGLKFCNGGYYKNCKIFNNNIRLIKIPDGYSWPGTAFAIEIFRLIGNNEIYNNDVNGIISLIWGYKGTAERSVRVYNNRIVETPENPLNFAVECIVPDMEVDHNYIYLTNGKACVFWDLRNVIDSPTLIHHNVVEGSGTDTKSGLALIPSGSGAEINGVKLYNNTVYNTYDGIVLQYDNSGVQFQNIEIKNNIFMNIAHNVIKTSGRKMKTAAITIQDNLMFNYAILENHVDGSPEITSSGNLIGIEPQLKMQGVKPTSFYMPLSATSPVVNIESTMGSPFIGAYDYTRPDSAKLTGTYIGTTGSNTGTASDEGDKAFDGDTNTFFDAAPVDASTAWVGLDLESAKQVVLIRFHPRTNFSSRMLNGKFQGSNSADFSSDVVDLYTITTQPSDDAWSQATISNTSTFSYVRYLAPENSYGNVAEIEFWGISEDPIIPVTGVSASRTTVSLIEGAAVALAALISPSYATNREVTWASSDTTVAKVSSTGFVTAVALGSAEITVTTLDGNFTSSVAVVVTNSTLSNWSVTDPGNRNVDIYPNPVNNGVLYITNTEIEYVDIISTTGQKYNIKVEGGKINMNSFKTGIYIIQIPFEGKLFNKKIVVE